MRVCLVSYEFPPAGGGEATYVKALAKAFSRRGDEVTLVVPRVRGMERIDGVRVLATGSAGPIREARFLAGAELAIDHLARTAKPDLVHVTFDYPTFFFHVRRPGLPCVATVHHLHVPEVLTMSAARGAAGRLPDFLRSSLIGSMEKRLVRQCQVTIAVSRYTASTVERYLGLPSERIRVVPNGIDPTPFERGDGDAFRRAFPAAGTSPVLYVGRLAPSKGVDLLLEAFAKVKGSAPDARLVVVGSGDPGYRDFLAAKAASLGLSSSVLFTGRISDQLLVHAYAACRMTVVPSYMEGFGLTALESMASARPSIATRVGGVPEVVADGETGLLVPPGDVDGLAAAMRSLLSDPDLATAMGEAGRRVARTFFTVERMAEGTMAVYREVAQDDGSSA